MTKEEASKDINFIIRCLNKRRMAPCGFCKSDKCIPNPHECAADDFVINKAVEALEKQIPKKPKEFDDLWRCPACNAGVCDTYCSCCGQKLEWRDVK